MTDHDHDDMDPARVEQLMSELPAPEPSAALRRAVAEIPLRHPQPALAGATLGWPPIRAIWALVVGAAVIVALGALSGALLDDLGPEIQAHERAVDAAEDSDAETEALREMAQLAFASELDEELAP